MVKIYHLCQVRWWAKPITTAFKRLTQRDGYKFEAGLVTQQDHVSKTSSFTNIYHMQWHTLSLWIHDVCYIWSRHQACHGTWYHSTVCLPAHRDIDNILRACSSGKYCSVGFCRTGSNQSSLPLLTVETTACVPQALIQCGKVESLWDRLSVADHVTCQLVNQYAGTNPVPCPS